MRLIIAGSRDLDLRHPLRVSDFVNYFFNYSNPSEVVSGGANGIDILGEEFAYGRGIPVKKFLPDYKMYPGKVAPIMRNKEMAKYSDKLLLIWDGQSRGSANMKEEMLKLGKPIYEVIIGTYNENQ